MSNKVTEKETRITAEDLSKMSGIPMSYIQSELFGNDESVDLDGLREIMLSHLDSTFMSMDLK